jgi:hypothetical protein
MTFTHFIVEVIVELKVQIGTLPLRHHPALQLCSSPNTLGVCPGTVDILHAGKSISPKTRRLYISYLYQISHISVKRNVTKNAKSTIIFLKNTFFAFYFKVLEDHLFQNPDFNYFLRLQLPFYHRKTALDNDQSELWKVHIPDLPKHHARQ